MTSDNYFFRATVDSRAWDLHETEIHNSRATLRIIQTWIEGWRDNKEWVHRKFPTEADLFAAIVERIEDDRNRLNKAFIKIMGRELGKYD